MRRRLGASSSLTEMPTQSPRRWESRSRATSNVDRSTRCASRSARGPWGSCGSRTSTRASARCRSTASRSSARTASRTRRSGRSRSRRRPVTPAWDQSTTWTLLAGGDIFMDRGVYREVVKQKKGVDWPFDGGTATVTGHHCCGVYVTTHEIPDVDIDRQRRSGPSHGEGCRPGDGEPRDAHARQLGLPPTRLQVQQRSGVVEDDHERRYRRGHHRQQPHQGLRLQRSRGHP